MKHLAIIICAICLTSCHNDLDDFFHSEVDPELKPYVDQFFEEARLRGVKLKRKNLKVKFGKLEGQICGRTYHATNTIVIVRNSHAYKVNLEGLIFHEMAHLYLKRGHEDRTINNKVGGLKKSLMTTNSVPDYGDKMIRRNYYIDELFYKINTIPSWYVQ